MHRLFSRMTLLALALLGLPRLWREGRRLLATGVALFLAPELLHLGYLQFHALPSGAFAYLEEAGRHLRGLDVLVVCLFGDLDATFEVQPQRIALEQPGIVVDDRLALGLQPLGDPQVVPGTAGHVLVDDRLLDRQVRVIRVLNEQLDRIEQQNGRRPPEAE